jgi:hypothetical protein
MFVRDLAAGCERTAQRPAIQQSVLVDRREFVELPPRLAADEFAVARVVYRLQVNRRRRDTFAQEHADDVHAAKAGVTGAAHSTSPVTNPSSALRSRSDWERTVSAVMLSSVICALVS